MWRGGLGGLALLAALVVTGALLLALGVADPPAAGPLQLDMTFDAPRGVVTLAGARTQRFTEARALPVVSRLTLEVAARLPGGPGDAAYGLWLWRCDGIRQRVYAVTGDRYVAQFAPDADAPPPWTWFPHARRAPAANRLRVQVGAEQIILYVNDEVALVDADTASIVPVCAWGLYAAADAGEVRVEFEQIRVWYSSDQF